MASLRNEILSDLEEAFVVDLGDIPTPVEYSAYLGRSPSYDPNGNGDIIRPPATVYNFNAVVDGEVVKEQFNTPVLERDVQLILPSSYLPTKPYINDTVKVIATNTVYTVVAIVNDPANAHYTFLARPVEDVV